MDGNTIVILKDYGKIHSRLAGLLEEKKLSRNALAKACLLYTSRCV